MKRFGLLASRVCSVNASCTSFLPRRLVASSRVHSPFARNNPSRSFSRSSRVETRLDKYPYSALPPGSSFRLLELHPRNHPQNANQIVVSLLDSHLDSTTAPYEALSYSWNDPYAVALLPPDVPTIVGQDGKIACPISIDGDYTVQVTPNLMLALRALQLENASRTLWIDALCINQDSSLEKSSQVPLMTDIYSKARKVVIWLGEEDYWTYGSIGVINRWAGIYTNALKTGARQPEILEKLTEWSTFDVEEQACFEAFVRRAWFTRAWTFQELCLSQDTEIRCGKYSVPWAVFGDACAAVIAAGQENFVFEEHENIKTLVDFYKFCQDMPNRRDRLRDERFQLSRLLQRTRPQQVTDPRDKLYSLLGIANSPRRTNEAYRVDYTETKKEVYRRFTRDMIVEDGDLGVLSSVQRQQSPTKELEYYVRALREAAQAAVPQDSEESESEYSTQDLDDKQLVLWRDAHRNSFPDLFTPIKLEGSEPKADSLPSWVPDFVAQDNLEYVATDVNVKTDLPESLIRTKFPRPIAQHFNDGWPRYWLNKQFSYRVGSGDITHETGNADHLGVWGVKVGTVKSVFEMPFTSDPSVRVSLRTEQPDLESDLLAGSPSSKARAPPAPVPFNFDFTRRFWPVQSHESAAEEPVLVEDLVYKHTGERTELAVLRTITADMLPISKRLPQAQKTVLFPFHYDWYFWNQGPDNQPRKFPNMAPSRLEDWNLRWVQFWRECLLPGVRGFERDVSMPVGWENGASRVTKFDWIPGFSQQELDGLHGLWGISCEIQHAVNRASWNREFFITDNGYMGIGPVGVRPGDEVWSLIGGHVPFVLRPSSHGNGTASVKCYKLVGESYVHGIMDGELWAEQRDTWKDLDKMKAKATKVVLV
ncbi:unnamed protein product [Clonostachys rosea]|uniref:Heterokaryon incompatibility domain-containing protein n=1 Tax=Bionectria ochroleuca TaxID=29856 RepID=A0ABY6UME3_BIOOC|nr:unnamed protein product [Clonostachys rosea]